MEWNCRPLVFALLKSFVNVLKSFIGKTLRVNFNPEHSVVDSMSLPAFKKLQTISGEMCFDKQSLITSRSHFINI